MSGSLDQVLNPFCLSSYLQDIQSGRWHSNDNKVARDKVGNALRDTGKQIRSPPQTGHNVVIMDTISSPVTPTTSLQESTTHNISMLGHSGIVFGNSERLYRENNQNLVSPPPPPFDGFQLLSHRQRMMVDDIEKSLLLEERKPILPTEAFYYAHHQQAFNAHTHKQPMMLHNIETSPLEEKNRMLPTEAFNYVHQPAFNSLTSSIIKLEDEDSFYGNVSATGGGQVHSISNHRALLEQQQQQHHEFEEFPWGEQMALALEPTPLR